MIKVWLRYYNWSYFSTLFSCKNVYSLFHPRFFIRANISYNIFVNKMREKGGELNYTSGLKQLRRKTKKNKKIIMNYDKVFFYFLKWITIGLVFTTENYNFVKKKKKGGKGKKRECDRRSVKILFFFLFFPYFFALLFYYFCTNNILFYLLLDYIKLSYTLYDIFNEIGC